MPFTLKQLEKISEDLLILDEGNPREDNPRHNRISRAKVKAMMRERGTCYIWRMNPREGDPLCREYKKGMVYNFDGSFITSAYDPHLERMMQDRLSSWTSTREDLEKVNAIFAYAKKLDPIILVWA